MLHVTSEYRRILIVSLDGKEYQTARITCYKYLWIIWIIQLTLKQHGFDLHLHVDFLQRMPTVVLQEPQVVESADAEPQIWSTDDKVILGFSTSRRVEFPNPHVIQGSSVILECDLKR